MLPKQRIVLIADIHKELHSRYHDFLANHFEVHILEDVSFESVKKAIMVHKPSIVILDAKIAMMKNIIRCLNEEYRNIPVLVLSNESFIENDMVREINSEELGKSPNIVCVMQKESIHSSQLPSLVANVIDAWQKNT